MDRTWGEYAKANIYYNGVHASRGETFRFIMPCGHQYRSMPINAPQSLGMVGSEKCENCGYTLIYIDMAEKRGNLYSIIDAVYEKLIQIDNSKKTVHDIVLSLNIEITK